MPVALSERGKRVAFAHHLAGSRQGLAQQRRAERFGRRFQALHQRDAAGQQRGQHAGELRDLVFQPDVAKDGDPHFDGVDLFSRGGLARPPVKAGAACRPG